MKYKKYKRAILIVGVAALSFSMVSCSGMSSEQNKKITVSTKRKNVVSKAKVTSIRFVPKNISYKTDDSTKVLIDAPKVDANDIVKIIKHGDHWHVFTKDGREIITYTDPTKSKSAKDLKSTVKVVSKTELKKVANGSEVVKILKHGDHWHIFTRDGREFVTHSDPSGLFPNIVIGTYTGNHEPINAGTQSGIINLNATNLPSNQGNSGSTMLVNSNGQVIDAGSIFSKVVGVEELKDKNVVRILKHRDHYHVYTADGTEFITYGDPSSEYPGIPIGTYVGEHGDSNTTSNDYVGGGSYYGGGSTYVEKPLSYWNIQWPEDIVKIIDHKDHFHLVDSKGEEVVVHATSEITNDRLRSIYPEAEYIDQRNIEHPDIKVDSSEIFKYEDVTENFDQDLYNHLPDNIQHMDNFGSLTDTTIPVYGTDGKKENIFYWLHDGNHYHAVTIEQIIKCAKAGDYGQNVDPKKVVGVIKYLINHKGQKIDSEIKINNIDIINYLNKVYEGKLADIPDQPNIEIFNNVITVYFKNPDGGDSTSIKLSKADFRVNSEGYITYNKTFEGTDKNVNDIKVKATPYNSEC